MKKILIILLLICMCGCTMEKEAGFVNISGEEVVNKVTNKETFLLMVTYENSYACEIFEKEIEPVLVEENILMYVLDEAAILENDSLMEQIDIALKEYSSWPAMFYIVEGSIAKNHLYEYSLDPEGWQTWMENTGIIKTEE